MMRLDKLLCELNIGTRSQAKELIRKGRIAVNGVVVRQPEYKANELTDSVTLDGKPLHYQKFHYYMLNKPGGVVSATRDRQTGTVLEFLPAGLRKNLFPAGRLDKDTEGLILLTDDGETAHRLLSPGKHVEKTYLVTLRSPLSEDAVQILSEGVDIGDEKPTMPAKIIIDSDSQIRLTICEGRFHQVKRMLQAVDNEVLELKRISFGSLTLDEGLAPGEWRELTAEEIKRLQGREK